jgi:hypothetical protein
MIHRPDLEQPSGNMLPLATWRATQGNAHHRTKHAATRVCSRQGRRRPSRRRPTTRFRAAGDIIDFALVTVYGLKNGSVCPPVGPLKAHAEVLCRRRRLRCKHASAVARSPRSYRPNTRTRRRCIAARNKAAPLHLSRVVLLLLRQRRGASGLGELQWASRCRGQRPGHNDEHSEQARAPHTNGPRDVPRCGALSLLLKPLKNSI